jgi:DNA-binding transcriptional LysR family regulator
VRSAISFQELVASVKEDVVGHLRIACSTTAGKYILPRLAARFRQYYPGVTISILRCTREDITPTLLEGDANLGVVSFETRGKGLEIQEFFEDHISLIVAESHPWTSLTSITPDDLMNEPIIIREPQSGTRRVLLTELAKHDIRLEDLTIFLELGNAEAIVDTVAAGHGVSFVSRLATVCMLENRTVVEIPVEGIHLSRKIYMARKEMDTPNRPQEVFWSFIHNPENRDLIQMA